MFTSVFALAFFGLFRIGELVCKNKYLASNNALQFDDIVFKNDLMKITIRFSKTDQTGKSTAIILKGDANSKICPVSAMRAFINIRGCHEGPIFCHFRKSFLLISIQQSTWNVNEIGWSFHQRCKITLISNWRSHKCDLQRRILRKSEGNGQMEIRCRKKLHSDTNNWSSWIDLKTQMLSSLFFGKKLHSYTNRCSPWINLGMQMFSSLFWFDAYWTKILGPHFSYVLQWIMTWR